MTIENIDKTDILQEKYLLYIDFKLDDIQRQFNRKYYSLFDFLGDLGGFIEAVLIIPVSFLYRYAHMMYLS